MRVVILLIVVYGMMPSAFAAFDISKSGDLTATEFDEVGFDTTGLVGYWQLNGNANDSSGQGNNGTIVGATATTDRFGTANMAMSFDGVNDYIGWSDSVADSIFSGKNILTFSAWIKPLATETGKHWLEYGNGASGFSLEGTTASASFWTNNSAPISTSLAVGVWNHIVLLINGSNKKIYKDGVEVASAAFSAALSNGNSFYLGGRAASRNTNSLFDEVKIFNRVLTAAEILSMYNHEKGKFSVGKDGTMKALEFVEDPTLPVQMRSKKQSLTVKGQLIEQ